MSHLGVLVEGYGEVEAIPVLLRRIAAEVEVHVQVEMPWRGKRQRLVRDDLDDLANALTFIRGAGVGGILIVLDADDDCPATLGPDMRQRAEAVVGDIPVRVVIANHEYEAWLLAGFAGLRGRRRISADSEYADDPESETSPKAVLKDLNASTYAPPVDQPAMTALFDMDQARIDAPSFDKLWRDVSDLLGAW